jgi:hypothetical protein
LLLLRLVTDVTVWAVGGPRVCAVQGRTETVRPVTDESCAFVKAMLDRSLSGDVKLKALQVQRCACACLCGCGGGVYLRRSGV